MPGKVDRIRGMSQIPLDAKGQIEAFTVAKQLAKRGGVLGVSSSPLTRAFQTTNEILRLCPLAKLLEVTTCLEPWHMGEFEGEPSAWVASQLAPFVFNSALEIPGVGANSKIPGEALEDYLDRFLPYLLKQVRCNPEGYGLVLVCHYRNIKAAKAFAAAGAKEPKPGETWQIDPVEFMADEKASPASLWCVEYEGNKLVVKPEDLFGETKPLDDVYLLRHGSTDMNGSPTSDGGSMAAGS